MSEVLKDFAANIDLKESLINDPIKLVEGDNGNVLVLSIVKDGEPVDLTGCFVQIVFAHSGRTVWQDSSSVNGGITIGGTDDNEVTVRLHSDSYAPNGITVAQVKVYSGVGQETLVSSARFSFKAELSLLNEETVQSIEQYSILVTLIQACNGVLNNEQSDWNETNILLKPYIKNKPVIGTDIQQATQGLTAETTLSDTDAVPFYDVSASAHRKTTWQNLVRKIFGSITGLVKADGAGNISAAVANTDYAAAAHASRHSVGAADALSGYEKEHLEFRDVAVSTSGWATYTPSGANETAINALGYTYRKTVTLSGVTDTMQVKVDPQGDYESCGTVLFRRAQSLSDGAYIYALSTPANAFTIDVDAIKAVV